MNDPAPFERSPAWLRIVSDGVEVSVRVTPGARRTEVTDTDADVLRVRVAAPPVDGSANAAVERLIAERAGVRTAQVTVVRGTRSRLKVVHVRGDGATLAATLNPTP